MKPVVCRRWMNYAFGLLAGLGTMVFTIAVDQFFLWTPNVDGDEYTFWVIMADGGWLFPFLSLFFLSFGARPHVEAWPDRLVVRNVITDTTIPRSAFVGVRSVFPGWTKIVTRSGGVISWGLEEYNFEAPRNDPREILPDSFLDGDGGPPVEGHDDPPVRRRIRTRPEWYEVVALVGYDAYFSAGITADVLR